MEVIKNSLRKIISEWLVSDLPDIKPRRFNIPLNSNKIITIAGPRRAGKTYSMLYIIKKLYESIPKNNILYINFEDERLIGMKLSDLTDIMPVFFEVANPCINKDIYLFFDEIQEIENFELYIRRIYDSLKYHIYISGSSSKLTSREISTSLGGRNLDYIIFPLSFSEYLDFNNIQYSSLLLNTDHKGIIISELKNYLNYGGYPETITASSSHEKQKILRNYYDTIFAKDLAEHFNISGISALNAFLIYTVSLYSKYFSISKQYNVLKSAGYSTSKNSLLEFLNDANEIFFLFQLKLYSRSINKQMANQKKIYVIDNGIINALKNEMSITRLMENAVFIKLYIKNYGNRELGYWKEYGKSNGKEVDFVVYDSFKAIQLINVTYISDIKELKDREIESLISGAKELECHNLLIITWDYEGSIVVKEENIIFTPLYKYLLDDQ